MSFGSSTTTIQIGQIDGSGGVLSISYVPEHGQVLIYAFDPSDRRKAGIFVSLSDDGFQSLKTMIGHVDEAVKAESKRRLAAKAPRAAGLVQDGDDFFVIALSGSNVTLPKNLYRQAADLVTSGKTMVAASLISKSLSWISLAGAKELAQAICEHQQALGERE